MIGCAGGKAMSLYLGLDLTGAIALLDSDCGLAMLEDMPTMARGNG